MILQHICFGNVYRTGTAVVLVHNGCRCLRCALEQRPGDLVALPSPPECFYQMPLGYAKVEASELERPFHVHHGGSLWFAASPPYLRA